MLGLEHTHLEQAGGDTVRSITRSNHSFDKYLLNPCCVPGARNTAMQKACMLLELTIWWVDNKKIGSDMCYEEK